MTRIERVIVHPVIVALRRPFVTAVRSTRQLDTVLVQLIDSDGASGWGEAPASWRVTGESVASIQAVVSGPLRDAVIGRDADDLPELAARVAAAVVRNSSARSAVDCALHDLVAQRAGRPLHDFLGGTGTAIETDMTISASADPAQLVASALEQVAAGFRTLKIKVGSGGDDRDGVRAVRDAVGPAIRLRVDANQAWTAAQAIGIIQAWEDAGLGLEFVEQPVAARELDALQTVTREVATPILADESVWDEGDLREIIHRRAADAVNLKLAKTGGLTAARAMAAEASIGVIVGCMMESTVGIGAAAALVSSLGGGLAGRPHDLVGSAAPGRSFASAGGPHDLDRAAAPGWSLGSAGGPHDLNGAAAPGWSSGLAGGPHDLDAGLWLAEAAVDGGARYDGDRILLPSTPGAGITGLRARATADVHGAASGADVGGSAGGAGITRPARAAVGDASASRAVNSRLPAAPDRQAGDHSAAGGH